MLQILNIENIAVIEKAEIVFKDGFNVLTGETGAGKSIVIDSLYTVTGGRTSRDLIRTGADTASVSAVFTNIGQLSWFDENDIEFDHNEELILMRKISVDGKSACRVNGMPVTVMQLRELGAHLLDIHGQNDGRKLLDESAHRSYLDNYANLGSELAKYSALYNDLQEKRNLMNKLSISETERIDRIEKLSMHISEIEEISPRVGEYVDLKSRRDLLLNSSKLTEAIEAAFEALYGSAVTETEGAVALILKAKDHLDYAARYTEGQLDGINERLNDLRYSAHDVSDELRDFREQLQFSQSDLDKLEERLDLLKRIEKKYGGEKEAIDYLEHAKKELSDTELSEQLIKELNIEIESMYNETLAHAAKLSIKRKKAAEALQKQVMDELSQLNMPGVEFIVEFEAINSGDGLNSSGSDNLYFMMSANAGEKPGKINRIASGGELARIMLALKNVLSFAQDTSTVVFDEIDTGVSGISAQRVAEKLAKLAKNRQVLCVTHLPQIAVMADSHFEISKSISSGRTFTHVKELDFSGRKHEIARLSGGENVTTTTLDSAAEQLNAADLFKQGI